MTSERERERTIAAAALASGHPAVSTSFRFHRLRGPVCGRGYCCQCEVTTTCGRALACEAPAGSGRRRADPLRPLGRLAERWPPWFYERRFLRTELVRRLSLGVLRRASAAGRLGSAVALPSPRRFEALEAETVLVGEACGFDADAFVVAPEDVLGVYPDRTLGVLRGARLLEVRFDRLVLATGSYDRLPPVEGNDLPGILGLSALELYAPALAPHTRIAVWGPGEAVERARAVVAAHRLDLVWEGAEAPRRIAGRRRIRTIEAAETVACDLFVTGVEQPAVELALQAGARVSLTVGELPILVANETPPWLELRGAAARSSSCVPDVQPHADAFACLCEDVRVRDLRVCVADGFSHVELVKRRTGAMTGPCQGKLCASTVLGVLRDAGVDAVPTTARPLLRPTPLRELAAHA